MTRDQEREVQKLGLAVQQSGGTYRSFDVGKGQNRAVWFTASWPGAGTREVVILANGDRL
jgi:hypothetical protein